MSWSAIIKARKARALAQANNPAATFARDALFLKFAQLNAELRYIDAERHVRFMRWQAQNPA